MDTKLSVIIPSRNEQFLQKTIDDILEKAEGEIEIIAVLDGEWTKPELKNNDKLKIVHFGEPKGMRSAINAGVAVAIGEYIMKCDGHCMFSKGFDIKLIADCKDNYVCVPTRKRLDAENWCEKNVGKPDIDYMYLCYPDDPNDRGGAGLHGKEWKEKNREDSLKKELISDLCSAQGSCWFMKKDYFEFLDLMDEDNYGKFGSEFQEIGLKCWLSGGRVIRNKKVWYAHLHKGKIYGRGYFLDNREMKKANEYTNKWIKNEAWYKQTFNFSSLIEKFMPMPEWDEKRLKEIKKYDKNNLLNYLTKSSIEKQEVELKTKTENKIVEVKDDKEIVLKSRIDLAKYFNSKGFKVGAEIGVCDGRYSEILCQKIKGLKLYCIDLWNKYEDNWGSKEYHNKAYNEAKEKLSKYNTEIIRKKSIEASFEIPDNSLDFVFIDGDHHFDFVMTDIIIWSRKVRKGGIVALHDFTFFHNSGIVEAVNKYTEIHKIELNVIQRNQHNSRDDRQPVAWWVKK